MAMVMVKMLSKVGSSYSLIIDKALLQILNIEPDTPLEIKTDGKSLIVTPISDAPKSKKRLASPTIQKAFEASLEQYGEVYKKLAE